MNYRALFFGCLTVVQLAGAGSIVACSDENGAPVDGDVAGGVGAGPLGASGAGQGGGGEAGFRHCPSSRTATVRGSGFSEYEGFRAIGQPRATPNCPGVLGAAVITEGAFSLAMTASSGPGAATVFIDFNGNGQADADEPDWGTADGGAHEGDAWAITPADFETVRHLRARAAGLPAAYEGLALTYALCEGPELDASCGGGATGVRVEGGAFDASFSYNGPAHRGLYLWLGDGDVVPESGEPSFRDTLPLPSRCAVESVATSCELGAADFAPAP